MNFNEIRMQYFRHYNSGEYRRALALFDQIEATCTENAAALLYWRACVECLLDLPEAGLRTLQEIVARGLWLDPNLACSDPDLARLRDDAAFKAVLEAFTERQATARQRALPRLLILRPAASTPSPYPLLIAIHGRSDSGRNFAEYWRPLTDRGWLVALPTSSQILGSDSFGWDDQAQAESELQAHYARLENDFPLDDTRILLAGFSQGGGLSISLALSQTIPATGFLALSPYLHAWQSRDATETPLTRPTYPLKGVIVTGERDRYQSLFAEFEARLQRAGIDYQRRRCPEMAHEFPPAFPALLDETLEYLYA